MLPRWRVVIEVRGCFWHLHEDCRLATKLSTSPDFWDAKFRANVERDKRNVMLLRDAGWTVAIVWECALKARNIDVVTGAPHVDAVGRGDARNPHGARGSRSGTALLTGPQPWCPDRNLSGFLCPFEEPLHSSQPLLFAERAEAGDLVIPPDHARSAPRDRLHAVRADTG